MILLLTTTAILLPFTFSIDINRKSREINSKSGIELGLNLIPPENDGYRYEQKEIYRCRGVPDDGYRYEPPRIQLVEDPNNIGYKVAGPKIIYIDCTTTTRKPNTEKILQYHFEMSFTNYPQNYTTEKYEPVVYRSTPGRTRKPNTEKILQYHFEMSFTNYPQNYTTEKYEPVVYRSTPGRRYLPEGSTTASSVERTSTFPFSKSTSYNRPTPSSQTSVFIAPFTGFMKTSTKGPTPFTFTSSEFSKTPSKYTPFIPSKTRSPNTFAPFSFTTPNPFKTTSTSRPFESTTRGPFSKLPFFSSTTPSTRLSTSGSGYLPPESGGLYSNRNSFG